MGVPFEALIPGVIIIAVWMILSPSLNTRGPY